ncbi:ABC transporter substrate-binding protein [Roseomonas sp. BN140053]|uniref:ABC transporter substrate-binding protein n=1 Tax=Roseomonas sp. BN140053 TaxID=3391898 RepID=UPI0039ECC5CC
MRHKRIGAVLAGLLATWGMQAPAAAPERIKLGYITTLSGPGGQQGEEMQRAFQLGLESLGGKLGGVPVDLVVGDDQARPQAATQVVRQMMDRDGVQLVTGLIYSNVVEAVTATVMPTGRLVVASVGGSSELAGPNCNQNFFVMSWNTDTVFEAIGEVLKRSGARRVAVVAQNFQAGWDVVTGVKRGYGGDLVGEILVRIDQSDFAAELTQLRQSRPDAIVYFLPGGPGNAFIRQFTQAGLNRTIKTYAATFQIDEMSFAAVGDVALGIQTVGSWSPGLDNPANRRFVTAFRERYNRTPGILAAMAYDTVFMLDAAVREAGGRITDTDAMRTALRQARFESVRGPLSFNTNNFPIQNFYLNRVGRNAQGGLQTELVETVAERRADVHAARCPSR